MTNLKDQKHTSDTQQSSMQSRYVSAVNLLNSGHIDEAIQEFRLLVHKSPDDNWKATVLLGEARCYTITGRLDDADRVLAQIDGLKIIDSLRMNVSFVVAWISAQRGEHKKAAHQYEKMLQEFAQLWDTAEYRDVYEDIFFRRAIELAVSGEYSEAIPLFIKSISFPTLSANDQQDGHLRLGICYEEIGENDLAIREFQNVIEYGFINSMESEARYRSARLYFNRGGFAQAKHQLETILRDHSKAAITIPIEYICEQLSRACHYLGEKENEERYATMGRKSKTSR